MTRENTKEHTEAREAVASPHSTLYDGDWKLNVHVSKLTKGYGMRRYHNHGRHWYTVMMMDNGWVCNHCNEPAPDAMEGYINLAKWASDAD